MLLALLLHGLRNVKQGYEQGGQARGMSVKANKLQCEGKALEGLGLGAQHQL